VCHQFDIATAYLYYLIHVRLFIKDEATARKKAISMTISDAVELSKDEQVDAAWCERRLQLLEQHPVLCRIADEQIPLEDLHKTRGTTRGFPRNGMKP